MMSVKQKPSSSFVFRPGDTGSNVRAGREAVLWPHPDYELAAHACGDDPVAFEKLRRLCEDLETRIQLTPGPGTLVRTAGIPIAPLRTIDGKRWREVLVDAQHGRLVWLGVRNFGLILTGAEMDSGTRRTGRVLHAVAVVRLEALSERARDNPIEQAMLLQKPYLPRFILRILDGSERR